MTDDAMQGGRAEHRVPAGGAVDADATIENTSPARLAWARAQEAIDAGDRARARRWLERAHRLIPDDATVSLTLGSHRLACGDAAGAVALLGPLAPTVPAAAASLTAAYLALGERARAEAALGQALRQGVVTGALAALAERVGVAWCGLEGAGRLRTGGGYPTTIMLDGRQIAADTVVDGETPIVAGDGTLIVAGDGTLIVAGDEGDFVGSPLPVRRLRAIRGIVRESEHGLDGWVWCPADPDAPIGLVASGPEGVLVIVASEPMEEVAGLPPLAQPRRFMLTRAACDTLGDPIALTDAVGTALFGSPVWRGAVPEPGPEQAPRVELRSRGTDIVVPVFGGAADALACLQSVLATVPAGTVVHVVDDASPDATLGTALRTLAKAGRITLHVHAKNLGFPGAANTGLRAAAGRDVVLLNSDTVVPPGWLERLTAAAYCAPEVGSATPLTQDGSIVSYAGAGSLTTLDAAARAASPGLVTELPVGVGFCLYLRRDCLDQVGPFREDLFAQGYGEESEFCLRARRCGWRHVVALDLFVAHRGGGSFGSGRSALQARNQAILERHYPDYAASVSAFLAADPLFEARRRMDVVRWVEGRAASAVVMVSHDAGGGVAEMVAERAAALRRAGARPVVIVPDARGCRIAGYADLRFAVPSELPALAALLRDDSVAHLEIHHLLGHEHAVVGLAGMLGVPVEYWIHDAASFCPRVALIGRARRYCGEPSLDACAACVAALGSNLAEPIGPAALVARSAEDLAGSRRVVVPTADWARRLRRHFPAVRPEVVPWEDDRALPPLRAVLPQAVTRICVVGAIGVEKGFDLLLDCAADARRRELLLEFVVVGPTEDDERLMAAGPVFVTGRYAAEVAVPLIRQQEAALAFIPSIWPETWCFALSRAWQAGLAAVAFDLGAPAERIAATGRGHLLPLGLAAAGVNDALLRLASARVGLPPLRAVMAEESPCQIKPALVR